MHINYLHNPLTNLVNQDSTIIKEVHYYVYDDPNHGSLFVQHAFMLCWQYLQGVNYTLRKHIVWTDGYSGELKKHMHGILYHSIFITPHLIVILMDAH